MSTARVTGIASGITVRAKSTAGVWRDLAEGGAFADGEELLVEADGVCYGVTAVTLQERTANAWADATTVALDIAEGASHFRQVRVSVQGDSAESSVAVLLTTRKGQSELTRALLSLQAQAGARFRLAGPTISEAASATRYKGISDAIMHANKLEMGGFAQEYQGTILADREQFEEAGVTPALTPARGMVATFLETAVQYRVVSVRRDEISYALEIASINS